jgi:hypothetical protein
MEDDCWSILALENVNSLAASIALKASQRNGQPQVNAAGLGMYSIWATNQRQ